MLRLIYPQKIPRYLQNSWLAVIQACLEKGGNMNILLCLPEIDMQLDGSPFKIRHMLHSKFNR
jgi:hypothetical protein